MKHKKSVVVGMSGGVDSSVCAALLLEQGYEVTGLFMKNWEEDDDDQCHAAKDLADTENVCKTLGIELKTINFSYEYWERVFVGFLADLKTGRTPNPDIICNVEIKFKEFPHWASRLGADFVATGHYARVEHSNGHTQLLKGLDESKDQSYFLHGINPRALKNAIFPVGELAKTSVRNKAKLLGLPNYNKKDSTGICFIGKRNFASFVQRYLSSTKGPIEDEAGTLIGHHQGAFLYTIGQRTGLGIGGAGDAWYVAHKDIASNTLVAVQGHDHPALFSQCAHLNRVNWISTRHELPLETVAKVRYQGADQPCLLTGTVEQGYTVEFSEPVRAVTPGQSAVFFDADVCLGGGVVESTS